MANKDIKKEKKKKGKKKTKHEAQGQLSDTELKSVAAGATSIVLKIGKIKG